MVTHHTQAEYQQAFKYNVWQRKVELPGGQHIVMHNPQMLVDYSPPTAAGGAVEMRPRLVRRGMDGLQNIPEGTFAEQITSFCLCLVDAFRPDCCWSFQICYGFLFVCYSLVYFFFLFSLDISARFLCLWWVILSFSFDVCGVFVPFCLCRRAHGDQSLGVCSAWHWCYK